MKKKETMGATVDIQIRVELSAAENFLHLNKLTSNSHSIVPFTSSPVTFWVLLRKGACLILLETGSVKGETE
jgi:hypothetical protein